jgi:hypothetical protein
MLRNALALSLALQIEDGELAVKVGGLDASLLGQLAALSNSVSSSDPAAVADARTHIIDLINQIIEKGLYLNVDKLGFRYNNGQMKNQIHLTLPPESEPGKVNIASMLNSLQGDASSDIDKSLASAFPNLQEGLDELVIMEMASDTDKSYQLSATVKDGNVLFPNGKKIPIIKLLFPLFVQ